MKLFIALVLSVPWLANAQVSLEQKISPIGLRAVCEAGPEERTRVVKVSSDDNAFTYRTHSYPTSELMEDYCNMDAAVVNARINRAILLRRLLVVKNRPYARTSFSLLGEQILETNGLNPSCETADDGRRRLVIRDRARNLIYTTGAYGESVALACDYHAQYLQLLLLDNERVKIMDTNDPLTDIRAVNGSL